MFVRPKTSKDAKTAGAVLLSTSVPLRRIFSVLALRMEVLTKEPVAVEAAAPALCVEPSALYSLLSVNHSPECGTATDVAPTPVDLIPALALLNARTTVMLSVMLMAFSRE